MLAFEQYSLAPTIGPERTVTTYTANGRTAAGPVFHGSTLNGLGHILVMQPLETCRVHRLVSRYCRRIVSLARCKAILKASDQSVPTPFCVDGARMSAVQGVELGLPTQSGYTVERVGKPTERTRDRSSRTRRRARLGRRIVVSHEVCAPGASLCDLDGSLQIRKRCCRPVPTDSNRSSFDMRLTALSDR